MIWHTPLSTKDKISWIILCLFSMALVILKVGGVITVSWLWVFMPSLSALGSLGLCLGVEWGWYQLSRFVGDD